MVPLRHFSSEIVERCLYLHDLLSPIVSDEPIPQEWGPLTSTFLLAMAMPLIVIPMERIADNQRVSPIGDRDRDPRLTKQINDILNAPFKKSILRGTGEWFHFPTNKNAKPEEWLGPEVYELAKRQAAEVLITRRVLTGLRHALSHGNVLYLTAQGYATERGPVEMFAFMWDMRKGREVIGHNVLVVRQDHFAELIKNWGTLISNSVSMKHLLRAA